MMFICQSIMAVFRRYRLKRVYIILCSIACIRVLNSIVQKHFNSSTSTVTPWARFLPNETPLLLILAYQRTGSSFMGEMVNQNPEGMYMFEPLDGMYSAMYGVPVGWSVPSDITHYKNGSVRVIPNDEIQEGSRLLKGILTCDFGSVPPEIMMHAFLWRFSQLSLNTYKKCIRRLKVSNRPCAKMSPDGCRARFGEKHENLDHCKRMIAISREDNSSVELPPEFKKFRQCYAKNDAALKPCRDQLIETCHKSRLRAVKTVRATMEMTVSLLRDIPNFRLVHLIRDPRSVTLSRQRNKSFRAMGSRGVDEAEYYCDDVVRDIRLRKQLEKQYPGKIMQIVYEEFVNNPTKGVEQLYSFLNVSVHEKVSTFLTNTSTDPLEKWSKKLTYNDVDLVNQNCRELYGELRTNWRGMPP